MTCSICGGPNSQERVDIGYTHCTSPSCVGTWRTYRIRDKGLVLMNPHKQGLQWVQNDNDALTNNGRRPT